MYKLNSHYTTPVLAFLITALTGVTAPVYADNDDTEIYLNSPSSTGTANILLNLDTSGSMSSTVDEDNDGVLESGERSRLEVMKEATINLLNNMSALNVGLMRYHYYGGPILFPISNLNEFACEIEGNCTAATAVTGTATITTLMSDNNDDGVEAHDTVTLARAVSLASTSLSMGRAASGSSCVDTINQYTVDISDHDANEDRGAADGSAPNVSTGSSDMELPDDGVDQINGVWFRNVTIPAGTTISDARIIFTIDEQTSDSDEAINLTIHAIDPSVVNSSSKHFNDNNFEPSHLVGAAGANASIGNVAWTIAATDDPAQGAPLITDDIAPLVKLMIADAGWGTGGSNQNMVFVIVDDSGSGKRTVEARNEDPAVLQITTQVCASTNAADVDTGLRFQKVKIPQGQNITAARIDFTAAADGANAATYTIKVEDADSAVAFDDTDTDNISSRSYPAPTPPNVSWTPTAWTLNTVYSTPDLADAIEEVTNRSGWCGGNDLVIMIDGETNQGERKAHAIDGGDSAKSPVLYVTYDNDNRDASAASGSPDACSTTTVSSKLSSGSDDAEEHTDGSVDLTSSDLEMVEESDTQVVGLRFQDIPIAQGTTIVSAKLTFTADEAHSGATTLTIKGEDADDASAFSSTTNNITDTSVRPRTSASASSGALPTFVVDSTYEVTGLESIIQEIVNRSGWVADNSLALFISGSGKRVAYSYNGDPSKAVTLTIEIQGDAVVTKETVREHLKDLVGDLTQRGGTPILGSILEAAYYFRGEDVRFGRQRGQQSSSDTVTSVSHAASYAANGATVTYPGSCTADNATHSDCKTQVISGGTPKYKSPIIAECQTNYLINLTDGGGYFTGDGLSNTLGQSIDEDDLTNAFVAKDPDGNSVSLTNCASNTTLSDGLSTYSGSSHNECAVKLTKFLYDNDQSYVNTQTLASGTAPIDGTQIIETHTIGFNLCGTGNVTSEDASGEQVCCAVANHNSSTGLCSSPITDPDKIKVLKAMADVGGGDYFNANTSAELLAAFTEITANIVSRETSFASPSIAANAFNRLLSRDVVYFGLFEPNKQVNWPGNIKKYNVAISSDTDGDGDIDSDDFELGDVLDTNDALAVVDDPTASDDGLFNTDAQSEWSATTDGREIKSGGAGGEITDFTNRLMYTDINDSGTASNGLGLSATGYSLDSTNWDDSDHDEWRDQVCPTPSTSAGSDCEKQMLWLLGKDVLDEDNDTSTNTRWWFHDVLHSSPIGITYGETSGGEFIDKIVLATNDGALHFINGTTGVEEWAFMPNTMLANQNSIYDDTGPDHLYGLDSTPVVVENDVDGDGIIEPGDGDTVYIYISQRRGGNNIYGLDITPAATLTATSDTVIPKFLFRIDGGAGDFARMGQSWSEPVPATIGSKSGSTTNIPLDVLIFGGGYDEDLDALDNSGVGPDKNFRLEAGSPNLGNAIYIVDRSTGALIFDISHAASASPLIAASGADIEVPDMFYSIPSNLTVLDSDGDGLDDRVYVGDTGGQVWRVDFLGDVQTSGGSKEGGTIVGKLADISVPAADTTATTQRRFFYKPAVIQVQDSVYSDAAGGEFDYVVIGTGNRANPLATLTSDRLYAFRDSQIGIMAEIGTADNLADNYPLTIDASAANGAPIDDADLVDVTAVGIDSTNTSNTSALGWYMDFDTLVVDGVIEDGEKVLAETGVFNNTVVFTTYIPDDPTVVADVCSASEGTGRAFNLNLLSAGAALDWDGDGDIDADDRVLALGSGIPSGALPIFTTEGVTLLVGTGGGAENLGQVSGVPRVRTYWYEEN
tara:strand:+ start:4775 stop:10147 length:5373 start_codon:yes stop_codon:yes gene_type:complete